MKHICHPDKMIEMINGELKVLDSEHRSQGLLEINSAVKAIVREIIQSVYHEKLHASGNSETLLKYFDK